MVEQTLITVKLSTSSILELRKNNSAIDRAILDAVDFEKNIVRLGSELTTLAYQSCVSAVPIHSSTLRRAITIDPFKLNSTQGVGRVVLADRIHAATAARAEAVKKASEGQKNLSASELRERIHNRYLINIAKEEKNRQAGKPYKQVKKSYAGSLLSTIELAFLLNTGGRVTSRRKSANNTRSTIAQYISIASTRELRIPGKRGLTADEIAQGIDEGISRKFVSAKRALKKLNPEAVDEADYLRVAIESLQKEVDLDNKNLPLLRKIHGPQGLLVRAAEERIARQTKLIASKNKQLDLHLASSNSVLGQVKLALKSKDKAARHVQELAKATPEKVRSKAISEFRRTQDSENISPFPSLKKESATKDWIEIAQNQFTEQASKISDSLAKLLVGSATTDARSTTRRQNLVLNVKDNPFGVKKGGV